MKVSTEQAEAFLRELLGDARGVAPIGQGDWSQAFALTRHGDRLVARFGAHVEDFEKDRYAHRFTAPDLPVPRVLEIGATPWGHFCLAERASGAYLDGLDEGAMRPLAPAVTRMLEALRDADISDSTGFGGWDGTGDAPCASWAEYLLQVDVETERVNGWHALLEESPTGIGPFREALAYLEARVDSLPDDRHLIHNDLLHFNVLVADDRIGAVLDWGCGLYGDWLYDLATFTFYAPWHPAVAAIDWEAAIGGDSLPGFAERMGCYHAHLGLGGMAYSAFTRRWDSVEQVARRTLELIAHPRSAPALRGPAA